MIFSKANLALLEYCRRDIHETRVAKMKTVQQEVDERSNLAGTNKFELLLFRLGGDERGERSELFGINVFKIREIVAMPEITAVAGSMPHVLGVVNLRGVKESGAAFAIRIKPTVHRANFREMPALVRWAEAIGATSVDFSPVRAWTPEVGGFVP